MLLTPRRLFMVLGLLAAVIIVGIRGQSLFLERTRLLQERQVQAGTLAQFASTYSARIYDQSGHVADEISDHMREGHPTRAELNAYLEQRAAGSSANDYLVVLDKAGEVYATSEKTVTPASFGGPQFEERSRDLSRQVGPVIKSRLTGAIIYPLRSRLEDAGGAFAGMASVNLRPEGIRPTASRKPEDPMLTIWDGDGRFIAGTFVDFRPDGTAIAPPKPAGLGVVGSAAKKDPHVLASALPVQGWPLIAVASYDKRGVLTEWRQDVYENLALMGLVLLGIGTLVWFGVKTADREEAAKTAHQAASATAAEALKDRDLLMKEVHHRVKNSLLMTAGLIHLQERRFKDPEVREAFESTRRRLHSIGLVHEALYSGSSLEAVDLADYLPRLLHEIAEAHGADARGVNVAIEVEPLLLAPGQITPVGLIVTELVTNAFKHAFGPNGSGTITVSGKLLNRDEIAIEVRDDGEGSPALEGGSGGLGSRLIRSLTDQLQGVLSLSNEGGAAFRVTFPRMAVPAA